MPSSVCAVPERNAIYATSKRGSHFRKCFAASPLLACCQSYTTQVLTKTKILQKQHLEMNTITTSGGQTITISNGIASVVNPSSSILVNRWIVSAVVISSNSYRSRIFITELQPMLLMMKRMTMAWMMTAMTVSERTGTRTLWGTARRSPRSLPLQVGSTVWSFVLLIPYFSPQPSQVWLPANASTLSHV